MELTERGLAHCAFGVGERVADLGCGPGVTLALLAERGLSPVGMDRSAAMLQEAERRLSGVPLLAGTLEGLPFRDACMDGIVSNASSPCRTPLNGLWGRWGVSCGRGDGCCLRT
ncbi:MAG: class I SAM-dependent methyltransferase [Bilophila wadsworthia]